MRILPNSRFTSRRVPTLLIYVACLAAPLVLAGLADRYLQPAKAAAAPVSVKSAAPSPAAMATVTSHTATAKTPVPFSAK